MYWLIILITPVFTSWRLEAHLPFYVPPLASGKNVFFHLATLQPFQAIWMCQSACRVTPPRHSSFHIWRLGGAETSTGEGNETEPAVNPNRSRGHRAGRESWGWSNKGEEGWSVAWKQNITWCSAVLGIKRKRESGRGWIERAETWLPHSSESIEHRILKT